MCILVAAYRSIMIFNSPKTVILLFEKSSPKLVREKLPNVVISLADWSLWGLRSQIIDVVTSQMDVYWMLYNWLLKGPSLTLIKKSKSKFEFLETVRNSNF